MNGNGSEILELNISGEKKTMVSRSVLTCVPETSLEALFSGRHPVQKIDGCIFVDRNPVGFQYLIDYLRNGKVGQEHTEKIYKNLLDLELKYWGLKIEEPLETKIKIDSNISFNSDE